MGTLGEKRGDQKDPATRVFQGLRIATNEELSGLERFLDGMARRNGGRVLAVSGDRLGDYVVTDYVRARRSARGG